MKVGDYVRIKNGELGKIKENDGELIKYCVGTLYGIDLDRNCLDREVLKSSPNIIDLIEVGDYVNGCLVSEIKDKWLILNYADIETYEQLERKNENVKSIVTKEQFESIQYHLESEVN